MLLVDTGGYLMDRAGEHGFLRNYAAVRDRWTYHGYHKFGYDVVNLSRHELPYLASLASSDNKTVQDSGVSEVRTVSANLETAGPLRKFGIEPYAIVDADSTDQNGQKSKPIRVAFVGLCDSGKNLPSEFKVLDPIEAAKKIVPEARSKADIVVVLAHLDTAKAIAVASSVPGIDVLISGNEQEFTRPLRVGKTLVLFSCYETRSLGEVRFYPSAEGGFATKDRYISLDNTIPDDPAATTFVDAMVAAVKDSVRRFARDATTQPSTKPENEPAVFAGARSCAKCHTAQYMSWLNSPHARATASLTPKADELESSCFTCHTTGFEKGGFQEVGVNRKFSNVQCEQCHGPALEHIAKPDKNYGHISETGTICITCHTGQTSPGFDPHTALSIIKH